jgi:DNA-binding NarL/FixJ family response regulator
MIDKGTAQHGMIETPRHEEQPITTAPTATAIVSRPGIMQQSLRASLAACPSIAVVASLGDGLSALNYATAHKPGLLVIDCNLLDDETDALLAGVKVLQLPTRCLVLTRSHQQGAWALAHGADAAHPHDGSFQELQAVLAQMRNGHPAQT